uniref:Uncharacterized protein n=1 Tax=Pyricularia oryzae (strain P131) TaxID=1143193 RepID=L7JD78_PYRO1
MSSDDKAASTALPCFIYIRVPFNPKSLLLRVQGRTRATQR